MKAIFKVILYVGIIISFLFATNLNLYKTNYYNPSLYIFRCIREPKEELVINYFMEELRAKFGTGILETYSIPKELREEKERIDIVIIYEGIKENRLLSVASKISFEIAVKYGEAVVPIALSTEEYNNIFKNFSSIDKYFELADLRSENPNESLNPKPTSEDVEIRTKGYYDMGKKDLDSAEILLEKEKYRNAFREAYFAYENFVKIIILKELKEYPSTKHPVLSTQLSRIIQENPSLEDELEEFYEKMVIFVGKRNPFFYGWTDIKTKYMTEVPIEDVKDIIKYAEELMKYIQEKYKL